MKHIKYIILALIVAAAASFGVMKLTEVQRAEKSFVYVMEALKKGDTDKASLYVKGGEIINRDVLSEYEGSKELIALLFSEISYDINSAQKTDKKTIKLNVDITAPDMKSIFASSVMDILTMRFKNAFTFGENKLDDKEVNAETIKIIIEKMKADKETVTSNADINIVKTDSGWKIDAVDTVKDAITGGLISGIKDLTNALG